MSHHVITVLTEQGSLSEETCRFSTLGLFNMSFCFNVLTPFFFTFIIVTHLLFFFCTVVSPLFLPVLVLSYPLDNSQQFFSGTE